MPLASTFMLSTKKGKEAYVEPVIEGRGYRFTVRAGPPDDMDAAKAGTKPSNRAHFRCVMSGTPISADHIRMQAQVGVMGARLMAIVAQGDRRRVYLTPTPEHQEVAQNANAEWKPEVEFFQQALGFRVGNYGMTQWSDLFTERQLTSLTTFADLIGKAREHVERAAVISGLPDDNVSLRDGGTGAIAYAEAVTVYLGFAVSKSANRASTLCSFQIGVECPGHTFGRQALSMSWDYAEANTLSGPSGSFASMVENTVAGLLSNGAIRDSIGDVSQSDAATQSTSLNKVVSTDPPYYDNIGYGDLSDFFYVWLRPSLREVFPELFATLAVPKSEELVATPGRHGGREAAEQFFLKGMTHAMGRLADCAHPSLPVTIYYAFKQSENKGDTGISRTGWETFLEAVIDAGFSITGTWPVRTERENRKRNQKANALASSIVLVCRRGSIDAPIATRREFLTTLHSELPRAMRLLQGGNIAPVDLAQAAIGPGMAVFTRYAKVVNAEGRPLAVREALELINRSLDEVLAKQEGEFDADSRWAVAWFEQHGFDEGEYGIAETLSKAKNTSVAGLVEAGILASRHGTVRLLKPVELPTEWDPSIDTRLTAWEMVHHLVRVLEADGESAAAALAVQLGAKAEVARELCYRLYSLCERKNRASAALSYNSLVRSWPEISRLARGNLDTATAQGTLFADADADV